MHSHIQFTHPFTHDHLFKTFSNRRADGNTNGERETTVQQTCNTTHRYTRSHNPFISLSTIHSTHNSPSHLKITLLLLLTSVPLLTIYQSCTNLQGEYRVHINDLKAQTAALTIRLNEALAAKGGSEREIQGFRTQAALDNETITSLRTQHLELRALSSKQNEGIHSS